MLHDPATHNYNIRSRQSQANAVTVLNNITSMSIISIHTVETDNPSNIDTSTDIFLGNQHQSIENNAHP